MTFLPVVERELRVAARRRSTFGARLLAAVAACGLAAWVLWFETDWVGGAAAGRGLFRSLALAAFWFCLAAGPVFTADTLSQEKREGTLGLLFLTDLKGYDVVLGKLAATSINAVFGLLAILPVLALPLLLGGIAAEEFFRVALVLMNLLLLSLAIGMAVSSQSEQAGSAMAVTVFILFLLLFVLMGVVAFCEQHQAAVMVTWLQRFSPIYLLETSFALPSAPGAGGTDFWPSLAAIHTLVWLALLFAAWRVRRGFPDQMSGRAGRWREGWREWMYGGRAGRSALRRRLLAINPLLWLGSRQVLKRQALTWFIVMAVLGWIGLRQWLGSDWWSWEASFLVAYSLQLPLKVLMASEASARWLDDRKSGGLELLLTTPLGVPAMVHGHLRALRRLFGPAVTLLLLATFVMLALGWQQRNRESLAGQFLLVNLVLFVWDMVALAWVGTWQGLIRHRPGRAFVSTVARVLALPWVGLLALVFFGGQSALSILPVIWFVLCGALNGAVTALARGDLSRHFRESVAEQFSLPRSSA